MITAREPALCSTARYDGDNNNNNNRQLGPARRGVLMSRENFARNDEKRDGDPSRTADLRKATKGKNVAKGKSRIRTN